MEFLAQIDRPEQIADLISWALLSNPSQRQLLLETLDVETRLRRLIHFLTNQPPGLSEA
jgi:ATP-dependent Lon protease